MEKYLTLFTLTMALALSNRVLAQDDSINTLFKNSTLRSSGGYGAISNKVTTINGEFANLVEMYGGWYINKKILIGAGGGVTTNYIRVPEQSKAIAGMPLSYQYAQFGLVTEYVIGSNRSIHAVIHLLTGAGFTSQYIRHRWDDDDFNDRDDFMYEENWFAVTEPGIQLEMNLLKWMRFSPGVSYRIVYGSKADDLSDKDLRGISLNLTMKFGKF